MRLEFVRRHSLTLVAAGLLIISIQLTSITAANPKIAGVGASWLSSLLSPSQKLYHELSQSAQYIWDRYFWLIGVEAERNSLRVKVKQLEVQSALYLEAVRENQRLRNQLQSAQETGFHGLVADVIARDPSNWVATVSINRGKRDGLREGLAVVDGNALVGQTIAVSEETAKVLLISDASSSVDAILQDSRLWGLVDGMGRSDLLKMRFVEKRDDVVVAGGEKVIASGLDGIFPKGALLGVVQRLDTEVDTLFNEIEILPAVDVGRLETVFVVLDSKSATDS